MLPVKLQVSAPGRPSRRGHARGFQAASALVAALASGLAALPAMAHPHAWVKSRTDIIYESGAISALRHTWIFDAYYTNGATEGLDKNGDGQFDQSELAELTQINMDGLKEFDFFTDFKLGGQVIRFGTPKDATMAMMDVAAEEAPQSGLVPSDMEPPGAGTSRAAGDTATTGVSKADKPGKLLTLTFTLPLAQPVLAGAKGIEMAVRDPSIFIWFELAEKNPVRLVGAPNGCRFEIGAPSMSEEQKRLHDAFGGAGGLAAVTGGSFKAIRPSCPGS